MLDHVESQEALWDKGTTNPRAQLRQGISSSLVLLRVVVQTHVCGYHLAERYKEALEVEANLKKKI